MTLMEQFPIGSRGRMEQAPQWIGEVARVDGETVLVVFLVDGQPATGKHSPAALERVGK